jgi:Acyl-CoA synthetases (AMP-forming)/AMP-acid ligases II
MNTLMNPGDIFRRNAHSDATAVVDLTDFDSPREVSYRALNDITDAFARGLRRAGYGPGSRIALASANRIEVFAIFFGAMKAGIVPLQLNIRLADEQLRDLIARNDVDLLFHDGGQRDRLAAVRPDRIEIGSFAWDAFLDPGDFGPAVTLDDEDPIMQPFTSGTSGLPKGMVLTARNVRWAFSKLMPPGRPADPTLTITVAHPLYHKNAMLGSKSTFLNGGRVVMMEKFVPANFAEAIGRWRVTRIHTVPSMMARLLADTDLMARLDRSSVREVHMGSAPVSMALYEAVRAQFPDAYVRISYGVTEAGPMQFGEHPQGLKRPPLSVGYPLADCECKLINGSSPDDGMLCIRNAGVMRGYYGEPALTAARFDEEGWYLTGDIFRRDEQGFYYFVGRADDMFVVDGHNLYPAAVEETLLRHADVLQAAVVPVADDIRGSVPHAFVVTRPGSTLSEDDLKQFCLQHAPAYQHPRRVYFVDALPLAGTGKIDVRELRRRAEELSRAAAGAS